MSLAFAVMGLLAEGERYGYQLYRELETELGPEWRIDFGQLYRLLATITRKRWVAVRLQPGTQGPDRKLYTLTRRGRAEFERWLAKPTAKRTAARDELTLKLRFGLGGKVTLERLIAERRRALETEREVYQPTSAHGGHDVGGWLAAEARRRQIDAALAWVETCAAVIPSPARSAPVPVAGGLVAVGSDDPVLDLLMRSVRRQHPELPLSSRAAGSLAGLIALREGRAHIAGIHLLDVDSGEYNLPFVKHVLPEEPMLLVHLARREQGLMVAAGNPRGIHHVRDLARRDVRLINRQRGAGTRLLLHHRLQQARIEPRAVVGYEREAPTHNAVAAAIAAGTADVGPGIRAVAAAWGLEFIPLGQERYDLAIPRPVFDSLQLRPLLAVMHDADFRHAAAAFSGYDVSHMAEIVAELH